MPEAFGIWGATVSPKFILTAAHCFDGSLLNQTETIAILLGVEKINDRRADEFVFRFVAEMFIHVLYEPRKLIIDLYLTLRL